MSQPIDAFRSACPSRAVLSRLADKWSMLILAALSADAVRFGALRRRLEGISQKMLSQTLRNLERDGIVVRKVFPGRPLRVEYELTARGRSVLPLAQMLKAWAETHMKELKRSNAAFDRRT